MKTFKEYIDEAQKYHPLSDFKECWIVTDGKDAFGSAGEVVKNIKKLIAADSIDAKHRYKHENVYFMSQEKAQEALDMYIRGGDGDSLKIEKIFYAK